MPKVKEVIDNTDEDKPDASDEEDPDKNDKEEIGKTDEKRTKKTKKKQTNNKSSLLRCHVAGGCLFIEKYTMQTSLCGVFIRNIRKIHING